MRATSTFAAVLLSACALAVSPWLSAGQARAADLDGESYYEPPYDDDDAEPGYERADAYRGGGSAEPLPGSVKDGYPVPMPPPRYGEERPGGRDDVRPAYRVERGPRSVCLERREIRRHLRDRGWTDVQPIGGGDGIVRMHARRFDSSSDFHLRVDRCSGEILSARPSHRRSFAGYERWRD